MDDVFTLNSLWRYLVAYGFFTILLLISVISLSIPMAESVRPYFIIMGIYFWAIYRPTLIPPLLIFIMGLLYDLMMGFPLALHAALFVISYWVIKNQRLFFLGQSYFILWIGFCITCFSVLSVEYLFFSIFYHGFFNFMPLIGSFLLSAFLFPLLSFIFTRIHSLLPYDHNVITQVD
jgi:rod shape-determining protein MreD